MKKMIRLLALLSAVVLLGSCGLTRVSSRSYYPGASRMTGYRYVENPAEQRAILRLHYPQLYNYYDEGLLEIISMREKIYPGGRKDWDIRRRYVRRYITNERQQLRVLQRYYPDVYELARHGAARVREMYEYVDNGGRIRYKVRWDRIRQSAPRSPGRPAGRPVPPSGRPGTGRYGR